MMAAQLSKADQIRKLLHLSNAEIAKHVGCMKEYVRTVRQRTNKAGDTISRPCDYGNRVHLVRKRAQRDPEFRKHCARGLARPNSYMRHAKASAS